MEGNERNFRIINMMEGEKIKSTKNVKERKEKEKRRRGE